MRLVLEFDDFSPRNSNFGLLEDLKDHFKNFKATVFTVVWEVRWGEPTPITDEKYLPFIKACKKAEGWLELAVHGLIHTPHEFKNLTRDSAKKRISVAEKMLINRGLTYAKIFKPPYWEISKQAKLAMMDTGFKLVENGYYNWNLKDDLPKLPRNETIIAHGHIQNVEGNGLEMVMGKLMALPTNTKFIWLSEHLGAERVEGEKVRKELERIIKDGYLD